MKIGGQMREELEMAMSDIASEAGDWEFASREEHHILFLHASESYETPTFSVKVEVSGEMAAEDCHEIPIGETGERRRGILGFYSLVENEAGEPDIFVASLEELPMEVCEGVFLYDGERPTPEGVEVTGEGYLLLHTEEAVKRWADQTFVHWEVIGV